MTIELPPYLNASYEGDDLYTGDQLRAVIAEMQQRVDSIHSMYEQACQQRDILMEQQRAQVAAMRGQLQ